MKTVFCKDCGKELENEKAIYCPECRKKRRKISHLKCQKKRRMKYTICPVCGKEFLITKDNRKYCCSSCKQQGNRIWQRNRYSKNKVSKEPKSGE
jgi:predicted amidophosphoribosyltransferase